MCCLYPPPNRISMPVFDPFSQTKACFSPCATPAAVNWRAEALKNRELGVYIEPRRAEQVMPTRGVDLTIACSSTSNHSTRAPRHSRAREQPRLGHPLLSVQVVRGAHFKARRPGGAPSSHNGACTISHCLFPLVRRCGICIASYSARTRGRSADRPDG
ncbi:hypothetical protein FA95DRAFT_1345579 [Auriscalpium vulgare]|uniref:Uncharacterized protein n=1 Tax=Auriscalpium vulgare TaxID=40419 RepID=A0ACB8RT18_9AGAM|nr:hypothetical protein FA95DRAFT_1345579 [Auriscalpium vulgare]